jgi:K+-sensing histidine kinase KdpD
MRAFEYYLAYKKSLQTELANASEMARHEREHLRMVLANVAHDLKTPLQAFDAGIHAIRSTMVDDCSKRRDVQLSATLDELEASCAFMAMQINRALDVSKIQSHFKLMPWYM